MAGVAGVTVHFKPLDLWVTNICSVSSTEVIDPQIEATWSISIVELNTECFI